MIATAFAERLALVLDAYLLPCLGITSSIEHRKSPGTVYLKIRHFGCGGSGYCRVLAVFGYEASDSNQWPWRKLDSKADDSQINRDLHPFQAVLIHTNVASFRQHEIMEHVDQDIHAGEAETSMMLFLCEQHVKEVQVDCNRSFVPQEYMDYFDVADLTRDCCWGFRLDQFKHSLEHGQDNR